MDIDSLIAGRIRCLRKNRGFTLEGLAELSGVSRSTISLIERQATSPTAAVLNKLANAFGLTLAALFSSNDEDVSLAPIAYKVDQPTWTDPGSGYVRRHLSPIGYSSPIELIEVEFPGGQSVTFENTMHHFITHQQVWLLEGVMEITVQGTAWRLGPGDCLAMAVDPHIVFCNPSGERARYLLALTTLPANPGRGA